MLDLQCRGRTVLRSVLRGDELMASTLLSQDCDYSFGLKKVHMLNRREFLKVGAAATVCGPCLRVASAQTHVKGHRWNVLFFLADDLGWHDTAPYGNTVIDTPNLTRFGKESARFTDAYAAAPVCSPSRASILTGQYPARLHLTDWIPGMQPPEHAKLLTPAFRDSLPASAPIVAEALHSEGYRSAMIGKWHLGGEGSLPTDRGFDINIAGTAAGQPPSYFGPLALPGLTVQPGEFLTDCVTSEGIKFLNTEKNSPYFLYESHFTVHTPLMAPQELVDKYRNRKTGELNPTYCAMVETVDTSFGKILAALDESGEKDRTIVFYFSDNGGLEYQGRKKQMITDNAPLRAGKGFLYEGGIREPLMVRWPGVTKAGSVLHDPVCSIDFFATFLEAASLPEVRTDGVSLRPVLSGGSMKERPLFWHYPHYHGAGGTPSGAVRLGEWKLLEFFEDGRLELYNLVHDIGERRNLVNREASRAKSLHDRLAEWRKSVDASMTTPNPKYDPALANPGLTGREPPTPPV